MRSVELWLPASAPLSARLPLLESVRRLRLIRFGERTRLPTEVAGDRRVSKSKRRGPPEEHD